MDEGCVASTSDAIVSSGDINHVGERGCVCRRVWAVDDDSDEDSALLTENPLRIRVDASAQPQRSTRKVVPACDRRGNGHGSQASVAEKSVNPLVDVALFGFVLSSALSYSVVIS